MKATTSYFVCLLSMLAAAPSFGGHRVPAIKEQLKNGSTRYRSTEFGCVTISPRSRLANLGMVSKTWRVNGTTYLVMKTRDLSGKAVFELSRNDRRRYDYDVTSENKIIKRKAGRDRNKNSRTFKHKGIFQLVNKAFTTNSPHTIVDVLKVFPNINETQSRESFLGEK